MIKIYTQPGCAPCHHAIEYLSGKGLKFEEINIRTTPGAVQELQRLGVMSTPAILIGEEILVGFDRARVDEAIAGLAGQV